MSTDDAKHENVPPILDLTRILKSCHKSNERNKFTEKKDQTMSRGISPATRFVKNGKTLFSKLTRKIPSLVSGELVSKQVDFPAFWVVISVKYFVLTIMGKYLLDS